MINFASKTVEGWRYFNPDPSYAQARIEGAISKFPATAFNDKGERRFSFSLAEPDDDQSKPSSINLS